MKISSENFKTGVRDGIPIALGYFAVSFSIGILCKQAGLTPLQGFLSSFLNHASAGEYAMLQGIDEEVPYVFMALTVLLTNIRYLLMGMTLSQHIPPKTSVLHRIIMGFGVTDEVFGISVARKGYLHPCYTYGAMCIALPSWACGTLCGVIAGNILPSILVESLGVALFGMFLAIIIPKGKEDRVVLGVIGVGFALSFAASLIPLLSQVPESVIVCVLTVLLAGLAAAFFPVPASEEEEVKSSEA